MTGADSLAPLPVGSQEHWRFSVVLETDDSHLAGRKVSRIQQCLEMMKGMSLDMLVLD